MLVNGSCSLFANVIAGEALLAGQSVVQNPREGKGRVFSSSCFLCIFKYKTKLVNLMLRLLSKHCLPVCGSATDLAGIASLLLCGVVQWS